MSAMSRWAWLVGACVLLLAPHRAHATYSITAADREARAVGGAGASCVPYEVIVIYDSAPGHGALNIQAGFDDAAKEAAVALLENGATPEDVIAAVTDESLYPGAAQMQYGVVDVDGRAAAHTGPEAQPHASHRTGAVGQYAYATQGNLLTSELVLERAGTAFEQSGCDLAEKLMLALEAGAEDGEGDERCLAEGLPARSAYLQVDRAGEAAGSFLRISVPDVTPDDPIAALRAQLDVWRLDHPCPELDASPAEPDHDHDEPSAGGCQLRATRSLARPGAWWCLLCGVAAVVAARRRRRRALVGRGEPVAGRDSSHMRHRCEQTRV
jgi:uncharacterized Ntn-hydrolase superfamily protein